MSARSFIAAAVLGAALLSSTVRHADAGEPLRLERILPLAHVRGRIDHMAVDPKRKRLLVAELGNGTVDVIGLPSGRIVHRFGGLEEPQGVAYVPGADAIAIADAGDGVVRFYDARDFSRSGVVHLGEDADNVRIDPRNGHVIVGYGRGGLAVIDAGDRSKLRDIRLAAHPEAFQLDRHGRAIVDVPDSGQIAIVDLAAGKQVAAWTVPGLAANFPMAIDGSGATVATVFRAPPRLVLLDSRSGTVSGSYETCADADDLFFDSLRRRIYVSCGAGAVDVFGHDAAGTRHLARIRTSPGARTSLFVPELDRLFVAKPASAGSGAAILVFRAS